MCSFIYLVYTSHDGEKENDGAPMKGSKMVLDMLNASGRNHVVGMTSGDMCETGFAQSSSLDSNFRSFSVATAATTSYEYDIQQRQYLDAYATNQESFNVDTNGFSVINLDILQGLNKQGTSLNFFLF